MNKAEFVNKIMDKTGLSRKDAEKSVSAFAEVVMETLKQGDKVQLLGFGSFEPVKKGERVGRNPRTGTEVVIPARVKAKFAEGKALKQYLND